MTVKVTFTGLRERLLTLDRLEREQLPFAAALALTRTAQEVQKGVRQEMADVFDRPTRWTLDSLRVQPATKQSLLAVVSLKDAPGASGRAASKWLKPEIYGGSRNDTATEAALQASGLLPSGTYVVPGAAMPLNQHGNLRRQDIAKALRGVRGGGTSRAGSPIGSYFVLQDKREAIGIAQRTGRKRGQIRVVMAFVKRPVYSRRFRFSEVAERIAEHQLPIQFELALARALATRAR